MCITLKDKQVFISNVKNSKKYLLTKHLIFMYESVVIKYKPYREGVIKIPFHEIVKLLKTFDKIILENKDVKIEAYKPTCELIIKIESCKCNINIEGNIDLALIEKLS